jgi:hypothetical protein
MTLKGPLLAPKRTIDVSTLSGWLMLRSVERQAKQIDAIEAERRAVERREAERREAERREAERREAEKREAERREADARATTSTVPTALPAPVIMDEGPPRVGRPRPAAPHTRPSAPAADRPPLLPPPLNIGPAPGAGGRSGQASPAIGPMAKGVPPFYPPPALFGVQR